MWSLQKPFVSAQGETCTVGPHYPCLELEAGDGDIRSYSDVSSHPGLLYTSETFQTDATTCDEAKVGYGWDLVRRSTTNTHTWTDSLVGTATWGNTHDDPLGAKFTKPFDDDGTVGKQMF